MTWTYMRLDVSVLHTLLITVMHDGHLHY